MEDTNIIFGKNSVLEKIKANAGNINKILLIKNSGKDSKIEEIIMKCKEKKIIFQFLPKEKFYQYKNFNHQGVIAYVSPVKYVEIEDFLQKKAKDNYKKIIILDGIEDPHNLGSIIRTAVCANYDAVIIPNRRSCQCNSTVEKTSAGAINYIDIIQVNSLANTIDKLKESSFWVIAAEADGKDNYFDIDYSNMNYAIVLGAEHAGISKTILNKSDFFVKIPIFNEFNSLNVANAASILIYETIRQIMQKDNHIV